RHPLQLTAGEFGRAPVEELRRQCHSLQDLVDEAGPAAASADAEVAQGLGQGRPDRVLRVESRIRVLVHELDGGPELSQPGPAPANSAASKSPMRSRPDCGARNPARALPVVVLPDPDSPTMPWVVPRPMVKLTSSTPMTWFSVRSKTCVSESTETKGCWES